jgi:hypothetical protein
VKQQMQAEYEPPSVVDLGSLAEITGSVASTTKTADGGTGLTNKTA